MQKEEQIREHKINELKRRIKETGAKIIAVSKTKPESDILAMYNEGQLDFGENKVQELVPKHEHLPPAIKWHMIGHLQRNKVKYIAPFVYLIHSVDSERLLREIDKQAAKNDRVIPCLLQVHIATESTKFGFDENELDNFFKRNVQGELKHMQLRGLMGMATFTNDMEKVRGEFRSLRNLRDAMTERYQLTELKELSMGMTADWEIALQEGATMVRVGSLLFGPR